MSGRTVLSLERSRVCPDAHSLILAASGSGKTTLLHLLPGLLMPQQGSVVIGGQDLAALGPAERAQGFGTGLNIVLMALGVAAIAVLLVFASPLEDRFAREAQGIDLSVGAKGSPLQLVRSSVYHLEVPPGCSIA